MSVSRARLSKSEMLIASSSTATSKTPFSCRQCPSRRQTSEIAAACAPRRPLEFYFAIDDSSTSKNAITTGVSGFPRVLVLINPSVGRTLDTAGRYRRRSASFRGIGLCRLRSNRASEAWELIRSIRPQEAERTANRRACLSFALFSYSICLAS